MSWLADYRRDVARYRATSGHSGTAEAFVQQGLWALLQYRVAAAVHRSSLPSSLRLPLLTLMYAWRKWIEITTGICLPHTAEIGPGLYIGHYGPIVLHKNAVVGATCDIHQGVNIGFSDRRGRKGVPVIGHHVWIGPNTTIAGPITIGDHVMISANSLVVRDVPSDSLVRGVPAEVIGPRSAGTHEEGPGAVWRPEADAEV